jgi:hypothetical protein
VIVIREHTPRVKPRDVRLACFENRLGKGVHALRGIAYVRSMLVTRRRDVIATCAEGRSVRRGVPRVISGQPFMQDVDPLIVRKLTPEIPRLGHPRTVTPLRQSASAAIGVPPLGGRLQNR